MSETSAFEHKTLTDREHLDPDKHWIGEALPSPSSGELAASGNANSTGDSPYPARADHTHDNYRVFGHYYHNPMSISHGVARYFDGWIHYAGRNILQPASQQLFIFPQEGIWTIQGNGQITTPLALSASAWFRIRMDFDNVTYAVFTITEGIQNPAAGHTFNVMWTSLYLGPMNPTKNLQMRVENYTGQDASFSFDFLHIRREAASITM